jgi:hypothetical protein
MTVEDMMANYDRANRLRSWAHLMGFTLDMGREDDTPVIEVDGIKIKREDVYDALVTAARAMGMEEERLNGE